MKKEFTIDNLANKKFIRFSGGENPIDFLRSTMILRVYNNSTNQLLDDFNVELHVKEKNQAAYDVFQYEIPANINSLKFVFSSSITPLDNIVSDAF